MRRGGRHNFQIYSVLVVGSCPISIRRSLTQAKKYTHAVHVQLLEVRSNVDFAKAFVPTYSWEIVDT